ncbi:hypothetical protein [Arthrobacter sp. STN4]|uniref:hypothetical protein n=1 Tax=Arthrobacter sp. STN4 TaxID=2923276 RepID=UPI00211A3FFC|nr:hypothetical protein [Arthrobacter sp. STN4]MCQ9162938.1 hypothetical protein [Arthrobacter sp. STN4]
MLPEQEESWRAIFEIYEALSHGWILIGGQSVFLHAVERGATAPRPTKDADFALDIRAYPHHLKAFTTALLGLGFESAGQSPAGHQHRWIRGNAVVDVLIPRYTGERSESRLGATGGTTLAAPAVQQAVEQAEVVEVDAGASSGKVNRPTLMAALVGKAGALAIIDDPGRERHVTDFLTLASVVTARDLRGYKYQPAARAHMANMLGKLVTEPKWVDMMPEAGPGVERLRMSLGS